MKSMIILVAVLACASASTLLAAAPVAVRAPSHDSAIIQSHRLGGNFAYSTHEAHAYAVQTPVIGTRTVPVGVSYVQGTPIVKSSTNFVTHQIPQYGVAVSNVQVPYPYLGGAPFVAGAPVVSGAPFLAGAPVVAASGPAVAAAAVEVA
ncbi:hypothetical protein SK128_017271 [Halocaridina rubra]|uniref:Uncharacterized protein n=1 Tax=Halocaridina rubra TaxID=373956 RepID=A0AAN8WQJ8_HALRR